MFPFKIFLSGIDQKYFIHMFLMMSEIDWSFLFSGDGSFSSSSVGGMTYSFPLPKGGWFLLIRSPSDIRPIDF